ncbi:MAG: hypothetical protein M1816_001705 [Peltula sp. TS41687]|nr:MAG: hypothetical protein M1816_001705 [Peltula sp. TS41687]
MPSDGEISRVSGEAEDFKDIMERIARHFQIDLSLQKLPDVSPIVLIILGIFHDQLQRDRNSASEGVLRRVTSSMKAQLRSTTESVLERDSSPGTVSMCIKADGTHLSLGASKDHWPDGSFLQDCAFKARKHQKAGKEAVTGLVERFNVLLQDRIKNHDEDLSRHQVFIELCFSAAPLEKLDGHHAQAFDGRTLTERDRCPRCRKTFGYAWLWPEKRREAFTEKELDGLSNFEERKGKRAEGGQGGQKADGDGEPGKCAEYVMWLQCKDSP